MVQDVRQPTDINSRIQEYRREAGFRRAAAFCDAPDYVIGVRILPLTPRTYSMLYATCSPFVVGGAKREEDVCNYLWIHSPMWCLREAPFSRLRKRLATWKAWFQIAQPVQRLLGFGASVDRYCAVVALAVSEIDEIINDAFADMPAGDDTKKPARACLEAQLCVLFKRQFGWDAEFIRNQPMKRLLQMLSCLHPDSDDPGELSILADYLRKRNAEMQAAKKEIANAQ